MAYGVDEIGPPNSAFVSKYLDGLTGIEVGYAAHNDYKLNTFARMAHISDKPSPGVTHYVEDAYDYSLPFADKSADFVFGSHVLEHYYNPLMALREQMRIARKYVVHVIPHPERCFDKGRPLTTHAELLARGQRPPEGVPDPGHWSVWTRESFIEICHAEGFEVVDSLDPDDKVANGFIIVLGAQ